jgi:hypothetical protein
MTLEERQKNAFIAWEKSGFKAGKEQDEYNLITGIVIDSLKDELKVITCDLDDDECLNCGS